jgi:hypothetical protein
MFACADVGKFAASSGTSKCAVALIRLFFQGASYVVKQSIFFTFQML